MLVFISVHSSHICISFYSEELDVRPVEMCKKGTVKTLYRKVNICCW